VNGIPRVVFDTNILFSAIGWRGNPYKCLQAARQTQCLPFTCNAVLDELCEKLQLKRGMEQTKALEVVNEIAMFSKVVVIPGTLRVITADPDDDAVLECAIVAQAQYLVSGDRHLLALGTYEGVQVVKAADFLNVLQGTRT
jgi:putative PIN family toxin of toxin-antitoxin system